VELDAAALSFCGSNNDCAAKTPFNTCSGGHCYDSLAGRNLPTAAIPLDGIVDMAVNSLDGNRNRDAEGPNSFFDQNNAAAGGGDSYQWSFYVTDQIDLTPPALRAIDPGYNQSNISLSDPVDLEFTKVMMSASLSSGQVVINNGQQDYTHKMVNLRSLSPLGVGYWVTKENIDDSPADGEPDRTAAHINHTTFADSTSYRAQAGSGVKDIYQNCFNPSSLSGGCTGSPSCCNGTSVSAPECP
jgi:hypothetical protein